MRFYVLRDPPSGSPIDEEAGTEAFRIEGYRAGEAARCPLCGKWISMLSWLPPFEADLETWGRMFGDLAYKGRDEILVSQRFRALFEEYGLIGLSSFDPVSIVKVIRHRKLLGEPPAYYRACVARSRAVIDQQASGFVWREPPTCPECREGRIIKRWSRIILEADTWSGEDVFRPRGLAIILVTERFKDFCKSNDIKNAFLVPMEEFAHNYYPWESSAIQDS